MPNRSNPIVAKRAWKALAPMARKSINKEGLRVLLAERPADPPRKSDRLSLRMYPADKERLEAAAAAAGMSKSDYVAMLVYIVDATQK